MPGPSCKLFALVLEALAECHGRKLVGPECNRVVALLAELEGIYAGWRPDPDPPPAEDSEG